MRNLPTKENAKGVTFTVADFLEAGRDRLRLDVVAGGDALSLTVEEPSLNRVGLALTGFFECFAQKRVQVFGNSENAYLMSLPSAERVERLKAIVGHGARIFVFTAGNRPGPEVVSICERAGAVLLTTDQPSRVFAHHATFVLERLGAPRTSLYGTMVEVSGIGVLFEGDPGLGKSETALGLIKRGAALVADDLTCIRKDVVSNLLYASASDSTAGYMEIRGIGIMHVPSVFGINAVRGEKRLQLVITFKRLKDIKGEVDRIGQTRRTRKILGVDVANVIIPVSEGRDLVNLVETAAQQQKLILAGYDPVEELSERLRRRADGKRARETEGAANGRENHA